MLFSDYDTRLAAYAVIIDESKRLLVTWWNGAGHGIPGWTLPGGGVEYDESLVEAVQREVLEETGYVVEVGAPVVAHSFTEAGGGRDGRPFKAVRMVYSAVIVGGQLGTTEIGGSTDYAAWVPLVEIPRLESRSTIVDVAYATIQQQGWWAFPASARPDR